MDVHKYMDRKSKLKEINYHRVTTSFEYVLDGTVLERARPKNEELNYWAKLKSQQSFIACKANC